MEFRRINDTKGGLFQAAMEVYLHAFPANERHPVETIRERVEKGRSQLYIATMGPAVIFMALLWPFADVGFVLLDYMATHEAYRGQRLGAAFLHWWQQQLIAEGKYGVIEAERPGEGNNHEQRERRIAFYKRHGAKELQDVRFILPALQGDEAHSTEMVLLLFPGEQAFIPTTTIQRLIKCLYKELYDRSADDQLVRSVLQSLVVPAIPLI